MTINTKKKLILIGSGSHSKSVIDISRNIGFNKIQLFDLNFSKSGNNNILNFKVENSLDYLKKNINKFKKNYFFISIGSSSRRKIVYDFFIKQKNISLINLISKRCYISKYSKIGVANLLAHETYVGPNSSLGNNNIINTRAIVEHDVEIGNDCHLCPGSIIGGNVKIGNNVFIGMGAIIKNGVSIPNNSVISAGSVILSEKNAKKIKKK